MPTEASDVGWIASGLVIKEEIVRMILSRERVHIPLGKRKISKMHWEDGMIILVPRSARRYSYNVRYFPREALSSFIFQLPVQCGNLSLNTVRVSASYSSSCMALAL